MYKVLIFIKKSEEDAVLEHFKSSTLPGLIRLTGQQIEIGHVDGGLLSEEKFYKFCEITFKSSQELNELLQTPEGKVLNRDLSSFHNFISVFMINYGESK